MDSHKLIQYANNYLSGGGMGARSVEHAADLWAAMRARRDIQEREGRMENHKYEVTKKQCAKMIKGVCPYCGGKREPIETVDNSRNPTFWAGCNHCNLFCGGVSVFVYEIAKKLVTERNYKPYSHAINEMGDNEKTRKHNENTQISGACDFVYDVLQIAKERGEGDGNQSSKYLAI